MMKHQHSFPPGVTERLADGATIFLALRQHFEMTLEFASEYADIEPARLWEIEGGVDEPTAEEREALALVYGVSERALVADWDPSPAASCPTTQPEGTGHI